MTRAFWQRLSRVLAGILAYSSGVSTPRRAWLLRRGAWPAASPGAGGEAIVDEDGLERFGTPAVRVAATSPSMRAPKAQRLMPSTMSLTVLALPKREQFERLEVELLGHRVPRLAGWWGEKGKYSVRVWDVTTAAATPQPAEKRVTLWYDDTPVEHAYCGGPQPVDGVQRVLSRVLRPHLLEFRGPALGNVFPFLRIKSMRCWTHSGLRSGSSGVLKA